MNQSQKLRPKPGGGELDKGLAAVNLGDFRLPHPKLQMNFHYSNKKVTMFRDLLATLQDTLKSQFPTLPSLARSRGTAWEEPGLIPAKERR